MFKYFYYGFNISSLLHYEEVNRANCTAAWFISCAPPRDRHAVYAARRLFGFVYKSKKDLHLNLSNIEKKKLWWDLLPVPIIHPKFLEKNPYYEHQPYLEDFVLKGIFTVMKLLFSMEKTKT